MIHLAIVFAALRSDPTFVDESKLQMFNGQFVVESPQSDKLGLFVIKNSKYSPAILDKAAGYLKDLQTEFVVRKEKDGTFIAWNLDGSPRTLKVGDIPADMASGIWVGQPVLKVTRRTESRTKSLYDHHFMVQGEIYTEMNSSTETVTVWCHLGVPKSPFVNVHLKDDVRLDMGNIELKEGTKSVCDGIPFEIYAIDQIEGYTKKLVFIRQEKEDPQGEYGFEVKIDSARFKADHPNVGVREATSFRGESSSDLPANTYRQFRVGSNRPEDYWKQLSIYRTSPVHAYFGHIPTAPFSDQ